MSVVEDIIRLMYDYQNQVGYKPTTLKLSRSQWNEIEKEIESSLPTYETGPHDRNKRMLMGMNVIVLEDEECIGISG
jgi:hypothetical protein